MIKKQIVLFIAGSWANILLGQPTPLQAPPGYTSNPYANTNQSTVGGLNFSNNVGQTFSPEALATQLQSLRAVVDQTLLTLAAFNESYSNAITGGSRQTVGGALSGIVSDVLHRNHGTSQGASSQSAFGTTNLLSLLHGLLSTNSTGAVGAAPSNAQDLIALQTNLRTVDEILQRLNVTPAPSQYAPPYNPNGNLTPTGR